LSQVSVKGEISNFKLHSSGHCYMTIKDETAQIRAVMFKTYASALKFTPENGMKITATGKISVYERDGQYQMYIFAMQPDGLGDLHVEYEKLKAKLTAEGIFDPAHKKPIPKIPKAIGVVTSPTGAAIRDIINVATRRYPLAEIIVCPVLVQGENSAKQIANAIEYMNREKIADVLIVGRGGGSIEDLWSFNEEVVAYAIYNSEIPIISAVGHETDFTIADFAADLRAPTPSAAAELAVPSVLELKANISTYLNRMLMVTKQTIDLKRSIVAGFSLKSPIDYINQNRLRTDNAMQKISNIVTESVIRSRNKTDVYSQKINNVAENMFSEKSKQLMVNVAKLDALSPLKVMTRGYSVALSKDNILKSVDNVCKGDEIKVKLADGTLDCMVENINKEN
ncbi:MAG: exodeoxyribonuclease VII large subunit, partial [Clostridia bacterium]|nr:exodeoxyribonuclease VII large subunit [Clostridia bacterium]